MRAFLLRFLVGGCRHRAQSQLFMFHEKAFTVCLDCGVVFHHTSKGVKPLSYREQRDWGLATSGRL